MNESAPVRLALIGCGRQMQQNLWPFLQRIGGHQVVACVDDNLTVALDMRQQTGARHTLPSVDDLDLSEIDAAILAVPPEPSAELAGRLLAAGVHCFIEKPAGPSTEVLEQLLYHSQASAGHAQIGFNFRYTETMQRLHEVTAAIRAQPTVVTLDFFSRHPSAPQWGVHTTLEAWIRHNGVHALDLARWFLPSPVTHVDAHVIRCSEDRFIAVVNIRHHDGSLSLLRMGNHTSKFLVSASVEGTDGSRYSAPSLEQVVLDLDAGSPSGRILHHTRNLDHGWARSGFGPELATFLARCRRPDDAAAITPAALAPSVGDALAASRLCDAVMDALGIDLAVVPDAGRRNGIMVTG